MFRNPARCLQLLSSTRCLQCSRTPPLSQSSLVCPIVFMSQHTATHHTARNRPASKTGAPVRPQEKVDDPLRPVAAMLFGSLSRRHDDLRTLARAAAATPKSSAIAGTVLKDMSTTDLIGAIQRVPKNAASQHYMDQIKRMLIKRVYSTPLAMSLQACHSFYLHEENLSQYLSTLLSVMDEMFDDLSPTPAQITLLFFYIFIHGSAPQMLFYRAEEYLSSRNLDDFHISDLGVICGGFFRANTRMSSQDLLNTVADKLLREIGSLDPFLLPNFLKMFRHSSYIRVSFYNQLADYLVQSNFLSKFRSMNPLMHIAFTFASLTIQDEPMFDQLLSQVEGRVTTERVRTKDISKFVWACGTLQFRPADYRRRYQKLVQAFRANHDSEIYPESLGELLVGLIYLEIFPEDLLNRCLSSDIASQLMDSGSEKEKNMQLLLLNETVQIECPTYDGNSLSQKQIERLFHHPLVAHDLDMLLKVRIGLSAILSTLQEKLGMDRVHCHYPLPHFNSAVIELQYCSQQGFLAFTPKPAICSEEDTFVPTAMTANLSDLTGQSIQADIHPEVTKVGLVVAGNHQHALNTHQALGHWSTKLRQLNKVGYTICQISSEVATELQWSAQEERCRHLSTLLSECLQTAVML